ncbi:MAG: hypothetical protein QXW41_08690 [Fervidicoccaceae archaeon]
MASNDDKWGITLFTLGLFTVSALVGTVAAIPHGARVNTPPEEGEDCIIARPHAE